MDAMPIERFMSAVRKRVTRAAPRTFAAVDLGSNSFHMIVARSMNGQLHVLDRLQEMVRLAAGLDERGNLDKASRERALACLARFGERLRGMPRGAVRAVGTNTLRRARNAPKFLKAARDALGHPIEIISGQEEARLIFQGVVRDLPESSARRLVIDIGGGSTEFIIGQRHEPLLAESLHIGCVGSSLDYFADGRVTAKAWKRAATAARLELEPIESAFRARGWEAAFGASGTIRTIGAVLRGQGWTHGEITPDALQRLRESMLAVGDAARLEFDGLSPERAPVFPGGVAILTAAFEALGIERLDVCDGALREGLLYDLVGRVRQTDVRSRTVAALCERYQVDAGQAARIERTAQACLAQVARAWELDAAHAQMLAFAARLHEIGLAIAHTKYHRHGAYLVEHSDLPGFSWQEQRLLAVLVRGHRRRFPHEVFEPLSDGERRIAKRLTALLRLAVLLHRGRAQAELPRFTVRVRKRTLTLAFPRGWLKKNPLRLADLTQEAEYLKTARLELQFS
jgi:exopolyphosphatase/guanosine-5'-triphosphate,3'-diphosphate pyrophosphatase